jgi:hypothetical protein
MKLDQSNTLDIWKKSLEEELTHIVQPNQIIYFEDINKIEQ